MKETTVNVHRGTQRSRTVTQSGSNEYPEGCVPKEEGWNGPRDMAISRIPGNNNISVCRVKRVVGDGNRDGTDKKYNRG
jgi:hypothetical protein